MIKILLTILIFLLPFGVVARINIVPNVYFYPHDIIVGAIFIYIFYQYIFKKVRPDNLKIIIMLLIFEIIGYTSLLLNLKYLDLNSFLVSISYSLRFLAYFSIFFAFQFLDKKFVATIPFKLIIGSTIFFSFGFVQYFFYNDLSHLYYLGWDDHLYRLFSTFLDPNFAGAFLVLNIILALHIFLDNKKGRKTYVIYGMILSLLFLALLLTYSRSAILMLMVGLLTYLSITKRFKVMGIAFVVIVISFFAFSNRNIEGLNPFRIASVEARLASSSEALKIIGDHFIFGVGFNAYRYAQIDYGFRHEDSTKNSNADASTDNSYLFVLATTGIFGFLIYLDIWINILRLLFNQFAKNKIAYVAFASVIAIMVNSLFINSLFYTLILAWIMIIMGSTVSKKQ